MKCARKTQPEYDDEDLFVADELLSQGGMSSDEEFQHSGDESETSGGSIVEQERDSGDEVYREMCKNMDDYEGLRENLRRQFDLATWGNFYFSLWGFISGFHRTVEHSRNDPFR